MQQIIYDRDTDIMLVSNPSGFPMTHSRKVKNNITFHFDIHGTTIGMEIEEASIFLSAPTMTLKQLSEFR